MIAPHFDARYGIDQKYTCLSGAEFVALLGAARPILLDDWAAVNAFPDGTLRTIASGLLPWTQDGQTVDVLCWPDGKIMVSKPMWRALGGT
jgi:hypothetical protein